MKQYKHMNKLFAFAIALIITLGLCSMQQASAIEYDGELDMEIEWGDVNADTEIGVMTQEYGDNYIAEILMINYDGMQPEFEEFNWKNPSIEPIDNEIKYGVQQIYNEFMDGEIGDSLEIRSYPFVNDELLQIVTTCIVFPETMPDSYTRLWSFNLNKATNECIYVYDLLDEYGLTQETLFDILSEFYASVGGDAIVCSVEPTGFLIDTAPEVPVTRFFLEVMLELESDSYKCFFMYTPEYSEFEELNPFYMFNPEIYDMYEMDPPLSWQTNDEYNYEYNGPTLRVEMDTAGFDELTPGYEYMLDGMVYVAIDELPSADYGEESVLERIKEIEESEIRLKTLTISDNHTSRLFYPTWLVVYETGGNEDTSLCVDLYIQTDAGDFRVHTKVPADYATDYHDEVGRRLDTVVLTDAQ